STMRPKSLPPATSHQDGNIFHKNYPPLSIVLRIAYRVKKRSIEYRLYKYIVNKIEDKSQNKFVSSIEYRVSRIGHSNE
ncbi:hypothetical protein KKB01_01070, partial [bacterium]|nr:hypothetical protein [bacterium]